MDTEKPWVSSYRRFRALSWGLATLNVGSLDGRERGLATWAEFEAAAPELASKGKALLYQYGAPLEYLATVRGDGGPRVHPFCPIVAEGALWAYILRYSPKGADLGKVDPRFALHAFSPTDVDDEFFVRGHAEPMEPPG